MHNDDDPVVYSTQIVYVLFSDDLLVMFGGLRTLPAEQARLRSFGTFRIFHLSARAARALILVFKLDQIAFHGRGYRSMWGGQHHRDDRLRLCPWPAL
jgi:hypothetical protein